MLPSKTKDLINMHYLDISCENLLKEMPLGMKELKDLHRLTNFIVGKGSGGSSLEDLKNLKFLRGEICISGLENILDSQVMKEKILCHHEGLEKLSLYWCSKFDDLRNKKIEENVLDTLQPHENIKEFTIKYYGGTGFPYWLRHPLFPKMVVLNLENCEECEILPSLGLLVTLKNLSIKGMKALKSLGLEIYGENCLKPFQSLETLYFEDLQEWECWESIKENKPIESFPCLRELSLVRCPKLIGKLPNHLPSLEKLVIRECALLVFEYSSFPSLCKMEIDQCKGIGCSDIPLDLKSLNSMTLSKVSEIGNWSKQHFENVEFLTIDSCEELICSWKSMSTVEKLVQGMHCLSSLEKLRLENCISLDLFPEANFLPNLSSLWIRNCKSLKSLPEKMKDNNTHLQVLNIEGCDSLTFVAKCMLPSSLKRLDIRNYEKLQCVVDDKDDTCSSSYSSSAPIMRKESFNISLLESVDISNCPSLMCISSRGELPMSLKYLYISSCPKLESIAKGFEISMCLTRIILSGCEKLKSIPEGLHHLSYLKSISMFSCSNVVSFPEGGLPKNTNLVVEIYDCEKLEGLPDCMHNLHFLRIIRCRSMISFPKECLPTNLTLLEIDGDLKIYKPLIEWGLHNLTSLKQLRIYNCGDAVCFPQEEMGMILPTSLTSLEISKFLKLKSLSPMGFQSLTSLEYLMIENCPKLISFPKVGLPSSLLQLQIIQSPLLKKQCKRDKGKEWSKIAHIPRVEIDGKFIYDLDSEEES